MRKPEIEKILAAINEYNRYRSPEANAKFIKYDRMSIFIEFSGPFCRTCGFKDWFDDMAFLLQERFGIPVKMKAVQKKGKERFVVKFVLSK
ncbi:MAG: hypothetical protein QW703_00130 [Candidatus Aenigmatarchaeota archaeon]